MHLDFQRVNSCLNHWFQIIPNCTSSSAGGSHEFSSVCLFICPSVCNSGLAHYFSLCCMKSGFNKHKKVTEPFFEEISWCAQSGVNGAFSGTKSKLLNFFVNLFIRFFWNCTWWQALKSGQKWQFWIIMERSYYAQNGRSGSFLSPKLTPFELFLNLFIGYFWNCTWWQTINSG